MNESTLGSKRVYKIFLSIIKYVPNILAILQIIGLILSYFKITSFFLTCIGGTSILFLSILYLISIIFRFCGLYRLSLNYVTLVYLMTLFDFYIGFPLSTISLYYLYAVITGIFIISWIIYWYIHRNNPKVDHIKQLCDRYICR